MNTIIDWLIIQSEHPVRLRWMVVIATVIFCVGSWALIGWAVLSFMEEEPVVTSERPAWQTAPCHIDTMCEALEKFTAQLMREKRLLEERNTHLEALIGNLQRQVQALNQGNKTQLEVLRLAGGQ